MVGHSLGAVKAVYAQSIEQFASIQALVSLSAPSLCYSRFSRSAMQREFLNDIDAAQALVDSGHSKRLFETRVPFPMLLSGEAFLDKYGIQDRYELLQHASGLRCESLFVYGESELQSPSGAFLDLPVQVRQLPNAKQYIDVEVVPGGDHFYTGRQDWLAGRILNWLQHRSAK